MSTEKMRKEYNAWYAREIGVLGTSEHKKWFIPWAASRAAIEVELPGTHKAYSGDRHPFMFADEVRESIESLGLKMKP